jgi:hypothetical protein
MMQVGPTIPALSSRAIRPNMRRHRAATNGFTKSTLMATVAGVTSGMRRSLLARDAATIGGTGSKASRKLALPVRDAIIDGEVIVTTPAGYQGLGHSRKTWAAGAGAKTLRPPRPQPDLAVNKARKPPRLIQARFRAVYTQNPACRTPPPALFPRGGGSGSGPPDYDDVGWPGFGMPLQKASPCGR